MRIDLDSLSFSYQLPVPGLSLLRTPTKTLDSISFSIDHGFVSLLGSNGCGKSTLLRLLAGEPMSGKQEGRIAINDGSTPIIGWVPQEIPFDGNEQNKSSKIWHGFALFQESSGTLS